MGCATDSGQNRRRFRRRLDEELDAAGAWPRAAVCPDTWRTNGRWTLCCRSAGSEHEEQKHEEQKHEEHARESAISHFESQSRLRMRVIAARSHNSMRRQVVSWRCM